MNATAVQASRVLESVSGALANWTVLQQAETDPDFPSRYGSDWKAWWTSEVRLMIRYLAQAVAVRTPGVLTDHIHWSRAAFVTRDANLPDLDACLNHLRAVVDEQAPPPAREPSLKALDEAGDLSAPPAALVEESLVRPGTPHRTVTLAFLEAVLDGQARAAHSIIETALSNGMPIQTIYEGVLLEAQAEIGRLWHRGEISVADEHFATSTAMQVIGSLRERSRTPAADRTVVAASVPGDLHELGIRTVADYFEMAGWHVILLGANIPADDIVHCLCTHVPQVLALSVSSTLHLRDLGSAIELIRDTPDCAATPVLVGGGPFKRFRGLCQELGANAAATTASEAVALGDALASG